MIFIIAIIYIISVSILIYFDLNISIDNSSIKFFKNNWETLLVICLTILFGLFLWLSGKSGWTDFGLNFFTEMIGVAITVLILERITNHKKKLESFPQRLMAYDDIRSSVVNYFNRLEFYYDNSVPFRACLKIKFCQLLESI